MNSSTHPKIRFAVIGLGHFAQTAILPAFANASENATLSALVTGDVETAAALSKLYGVPAYRVVGTEGILIMDPAYTWHDDIHQTIVVGEKLKKRVFEHRDQVAAEILYFAYCIQNEEDPEPSGREGLIDVRIFEAIRLSCRSRRAVRIEPLAADSRPVLSQSIERSPPVQPKPVNVESPAK